MQGRKPTTRRSIGFNKPEKPNAVTIVYDDPSGGSDWLKW